jgi:hypothetical protein
MRLKRSDVRVKAHRGSEKMVLRMSGPEGDEVTGRRKELHDKELHDLYCSPILFRLSNTSEE